MCHLGNHESIINKNSYDSRDRFSIRHQSRESFHHTEAGNLNERLSGHSPMESAHQLPSESLGNKVCQPNEQGFSDISHPVGGNCSRKYCDNVQPVAQTHPNSCNHLISSSAVTIFGGSKSSGHMAPHPSTYSSSSRYNENDLNVRAASNATAASSEFSCNNGTFENYGAHAQATTAFRCVAVSEQSIALLTSPPNDPLLEEFAREYLPHFGEKDGNCR